MFAKYNCENLYDINGKKKNKIGVWDKPCKKNEECPFFKKNTNYENNFGGCKDGYCEFPVGTTRISPKNIRKRRIKIFSFLYNFFPFWEQFILPFICKKNKFEYLICPYNTGPIYKMNRTKLIIVIHDLIYIDEIEKNFLNLSPIELIICFYRYFILKYIPKCDFIVIF